jgi:hypothetical protein
VKKASEYRQHADECRKLAARMESGEHRDQLLVMAAMWDQLAEERAELVRRHPEMNRETEAGERRPPELTTAEPGPRRG